MLTIIYTILLSSFYFAPSWIAKPGRRGSIFVINLFFGWTLIGWVVALFLAVRTLENGKAGA